MLCRCGESLLMPQVWTVRLWELVLLDKDTHSAQGSPAHGSLKASKRVTRGCRKKDQHRGAKQKLREASVGKGLEGRAGGSDPCAG